MSDVYLWVGTGSQGKGPVILWGGAWLPSVDAEVAIETCATPLERCVVLSHLTVGSLALSVSEADPYVTLLLPTAPGVKFKTKTVTNSSHPVWNETFSVLIQSQVKVKIGVALAPHL